MHSFLKKIVSMVVSDYYRVAGSDRIGETSAALAESLAVRFNRNENIRTSSLKL